MKNLKNLKLIKMNRQKAKRKRLKINYKMRKSNQCQNSLKM